MERVRTYGNTAEWEVDKKDGDHVQAENFVADLPLNNPMILKDLKPTRSEQPKSDRRRSEKGRRISNGDWLWYTDTIKIVRNSNNLTRFERERKNVTCFRVNGGQTKMRNTYSRFFIVPYLVICKLALFYVP